ncbi:hypothetical protein PR202_gb19203 [Eleusine coracana subsp. coracana]|uniref:Uncharacterized protein n=2 Tax=Eleusine coracana subsp. coracana TaxID=191504 RepID=A0AAV9FVJ3_ELECO|nr:hypothetical protein QOZ80_UnG0728940 [Eleusine coracana subsp. coracana]GJN30863.1 hypothetical protein PR202_gb19203 [Eleusine coracana subsp. coracana]
MSAGRFRRGLGSTPRGPYNRSFPTYQPPYHPQQKSGAWSSAPALPYAAWPPPMIYSSPSLPLLPSNQPPLLPLPPTAAKYATFPCVPSPPPPPSRGAVVGGGAAAPTTTVPAAATPRQSRDRRRRPARPPPSTEPTNKAQQKKKPLERATPLPPAPVVNEALDDLEQEVARNFVQDLLHALAPPPSSLPLPSFSLVAKASSPAPAAPSCNVEAAAADAMRGLLRL